MNIKKFFKLILESAADIKKSCLIFIPSFFLFLYVKTLSEISVKINYLFSNTFSIVLWLSIFFLFILGGMSFVFAGLIGFADKNKKKRANLGDFVFYAKKFWFRNLKIILLLVILGIIIERTAYFGAMFIGESFGFPILAAQALFILIYFAGLVGILIFPAFASFFLVVNDLKFKASLKSSFAFVKNNYLQVLALNVLIFVLFFALGKIPGVLGDLIEYLLAVPFF